VKFVFRLETPLRLARRDEDSAKTALGKAIGEADKVRARIESLRTELSTETVSQSSRRTGEIWIQGQTLFLEWVRGRREAIARTESDLAERQRQVEAARAVVVEKRRAVEVLERLRERRLAQWKLERARKELAESSDAAGRRWMAQHASP
jgi:flagellar export protein FliJ